MAALYSSRDGKRILMVKTWADRSGYGRTLLDRSKLLALFGDRSGPIPDEEVPEYITSAVAEILSLNPDCLGLGGMGKNATEIERQVRGAGFNGEIAHWGSDAGILASDFLRQRDVPPPY